MYHSVEAGAEFFFDENYPLRDVTVQGFALKMVDKDNLYSVLQKYGKGADTWIRRPGTALGGSPSSN